MSVDQEFRKQGIGKLLMEHAVQWAKNNPVVSRMELLVFAKNEPAIRLYEKFGFVVEGRHKNAIFRDGVYLDNLSMALLV
jgi:putative acetyltransferase